MTGPEKRSSGAIIGKTIKRLIGAVFGGLGLYVMVGCVINLLSDSPEYPLKNYLVGLVLGTAFFVMGAYIAISPEKLGWPRIGGSHGGGDGGGGNGG